MTNDEIYDGVYNAAVQCGMSDEQARCHAGNASNPRLQKLRSIQKSLEQYAVMKAARPTGYVSQRKDGKYKKISENEWQKIGEGEQETEKPETLSQNIKDNTLEKLQSEYDKYSKISDDDNEKWSDYKHSMKEKYGSGMDENYNWIYEKSMTPEENAKIKELYNKWQESAKKSGEIAKKLGEEKDKQEKQKEQEVSNIKWKTYIKHNKTRLDKYASETQKKYSFATPKFANDLIEGKTKIPDGWYVHGRREGKDLNTGNVIQMTRNIDVANGYGKVWLVKPDKNTKTADFSDPDSKDMDSFINNLKKEFPEKNKDDNQLLSDLSMDNWDDAEKWIRESFAPQDIVATAEAYDDDYIKYLEYYPGGYPDFIKTPDGAVAMPDKAMEMDNINVDDLNKDYEINKPE